MREHRTRIALFDVDGVLITPGGYRRALTDTLHDLLSTMNLADFTPQEMVFEHFESIGITSEWDMIPLYLCMVLNNAAEIVKPVSAWQNLEQAAAELSRYTIHLNFKPQAIQDRIGEITNGKPDVPSEIIFHAQHQPNFPYPALIDWGILAQLLTTTRNIQDSPTTKPFQEHILGSSLFEERYQIKAASLHENYLTTYDHLPLTETSLTLLAKAIQNNTLKMSLYTARPSLPPEGIDADHNAAYSPEAEQALKLLNLTNVHLSAYGKLAWIAQEHQLTADQCLKPSPIHALSAIAAHFTDEVSALHWAANVYLAHLKNETLPRPGFSLPASLELHVFEDSPGGLKGGRAAEELLSALKLSVELHLWGISKSSQKKTALRAQGGVIYEDVNAAIKAALLLH